MEFVKRNSRKMHQNAPKAHISNKTNYYIKQKTRNLVRRLGGIYVFDIVS